ncbi:LOW QUALITY PROTEIN: hypothetical protein ACHAWF_002966, partial [Thalassiosira exigua]
HYASNWTDAFKKKRQQAIPAFLFLYFACLAPAVSSGTISSEWWSSCWRAASRGRLRGVVRVGIMRAFGADLTFPHCALTMRQHDDTTIQLYPITFGRPKAFLAPTGLTLALISGLFRFCHLKDLPFFPVYAWVGIWTSAFMSLLGLVGSSKLIRCCTRFTDEVFNGMLSVNFIYEAFSSLRRNFVNADPLNLSMRRAADGPQDIFWHYEPGQSSKDHQKLWSRVNDSIVQLGEPAALGSKVPPSDVIGARYVSIGRWEELSCRA